MSKREADHVTRGSGDVDVAHHEPEGKHAKGSSRSREGDAQGLTQNTLGSGSTGTQHHQRQKQTFASQAQQRRQRPIPPVRRAQTPYQSQSDIVMFFYSCARVRLLRPQGLLTSSIELPLSRLFSNKHVKRTVASKDALTSKVLCMPGLTLISSRKRPTPTSPL